MLLCEVCTSTIKYVPGAESKRCPAVPFVNAYDLRCRTCQKCTSSPTTSVMQIPPPHPFDMQFENMRCTILPYPALPASDMSCHLPKKLGTHLFGSYNASHDSYSPGLRSDWGPRLSLLELARDRRGGGSNVGLCSIMAVLYPHGYFAPATLPPRA